MDRAVAKKKPKRSYYSRHALCPRGPPREPGPPIEPFKFVGLPVEIQRIILEKLDAITFMNALYSCPQIYRNFGHIAKKFKLHCCDCLTLVRDVRRGLRPGYRKFACILTNGIFDIPKFPCAVEFSTFHIEFADIPSLVEFNDMIIKAKYTCVNLFVRIDESAQDTWPFILNIVKSSKTQRLSLVEAPENFMALPEVMNFPIVEMYATNIENELRNIQSRKLCIYRCRVEDDEIMAYLESIVRGERDQGTKFSLVGFTSQQIETLLFKLTYFAEFNMEIDKSRMKENDPAANLFNKAYKIHLRGSSEKTFELVLKDRCLRFRKTH